MNEPLLLAETIPQVSIGSAIRTIRKRRDMTLEKVASQAGISKNHLSLVETGKRGVSIEKLDRIASVLGVPPTYIFILADESDNQLLKPLKKMVLNALNESSV